MAVIFAILCSRIINEILGEISSSQTDFAESPLILFFDLPRKIINYCMEFAGEECDRDAA